MTELFSETRWWWLRHGPIAAPNAGRINGQLDVDADLSDSATVRALAGALPDGARWITSSLKRTHQTAAALLQSAEYEAAPEIEAAFSEQHFGDWQGMTWDEVAGSPDADAFWKDAGGTRPPGGESFSEQISRVADAVTRLSKVHLGRDLVVVAHAGTIRAALAHALGLDATRGLSLTVDTLSLSRIDCMGADAPMRRGGNWRVGCINRIFSGDSR